MVQDAKPPILSPELCRAARGLLDWTQADLAERADVSRSTIRDYEGGIHEVHRATAAQIRRAFEEAGASFVELGDGRLALLCRRIEASEEGSTGN